MNLCFSSEPPQWILGNRSTQVRLALPLFGTAATRKIEQAAQAELPPHALMQQAGLAVARLSLALAPHAQTIWLACGPGNNGGDGLEAAMHLRQWGKTPVVTWLGDPDHAPEDAKSSWQRAVGAGVAFSVKPPEKFDFCIDALLGLGASVISMSDPRTGRAHDGRMASWIATLNAGHAPVLAVDVPTGLNVETGQAGTPCVQADHTLSLVTLKPGLFTGDGRDASGEIWLDTLGTVCLYLPDAWLAASPMQSERRHASHKGSFGDVAVVGGATGMTGAALLAASAALHGGAGRVFVTLLDHAAMAVDHSQPELMFRRIDALDLAALTVVCGCGGGASMAEPLSNLLASAALAVVDADALNAIAADRQLRAVLAARAAKGQQTILTPHPLEAARLLATTASQVQQNRLQAAAQLANEIGCTVVLKGSGTVIAAPGQVPVINPTGNARLATAGTGDVLAGLVGARMAALSGKGGAGGSARAAQVFRAACDAVYLHGQMADQWPGGAVLTASGLARSFGRNAAE